MPIDITGLFAPSGGAGAFKLTLADDIDISNATDGTGDGTMDTTDLLICDTDAAGAVKQITIDQLPVSAATQTALDLRCLESVLGTSIGASLLLDGAVLKASAILQKYHGVDPSADVLSLLDVANDAAFIVDLGISSTAAELNILDGVTATATELNYLDITTLGTAQASKALTITAGSTWTVAGMTCADLGIATTIDINGGTIDGTTVGAASATSGIFTTCDATTDFTVGDTVITDGVITDATGLQLAASVVATGILEVQNNIVVNFATTKSFYPTQDNTHNLGSASGHNWKDVYLKGNLTNETNTASVAECETAYDHSQDNTQAHSDYLRNDDVAEECSGVIGFTNGLGGGTSIISATDELVDIGHVSFRFNDIFFTGDLSDGANTATALECKTAYDHSQNNSQAHTDYLLNVTDSLTGSLTVTEDILLTDAADGFVKFGPSGLARLWCHSDTHFYVRNTNHGSNLEFGAETDAGTLRTITLDPDALSFAPGNTDGTIDLGEAGNQWKDVYASGDVTAGGFSTAGDMFIGDDLTMGGSTSTAKIWIASTSFPMLDLYRYHPGGTGTCGAMRIARRCTGAAGTVAATFGVGCYFALENDAATNDRHAGLFGCRWNSSAANSEIGELIFTPAYHGGAPYDDTPGLIIRAITDADHSLVILPNIPTADPSVAGALWSDSGAIKISSG